MLTDMLGNIDALRHCGSQAAMVRFLLRATAVFWAAYTIVALIMISSGDSSMRGTGESLMKGVLKSGLRVGAIVLIPIVIGAIVKAVKKNK